MKHALPEAILLEALYGALWLSPDFRGRLPLFLALFLSAAFAALLFARSAGGRSSPRAILLWGLLFRLTVIARSPDLSDDLYRYVWDGRVARAGFSPYALAPEDARLQPLRDGDWQKMGHRDARTVYPPAAQVLFALAARTGGPRTALKILFSAFDLAVVWLLLGFPGGAPAAALYAAFPLAVWESAGMGHVDAAGVALLLAALLLLQRGRRLPAGAALALSALVKYVSLFAALPLLRRGRTALLVAFVLVAGSLWFGASRGTDGPLSGLPNFATRWEGNSVVYPAVEKAVEALRLPDRAKRAYAEWKSVRPQKPWMERVWPFFYPAFFARVILGIALAGGLAAIALRAKDPVAGAAASLELLLLLSPVFHPWYALWILPFAALLRRASWLYLSAAVALAYALFFPVALLPKPAVLALEYVPFALLRLREGSWSSA